MRVIRCKKCCCILAKCNRTAMSHYEEVFNGGDAEKYTVEWGKEVYFPNLNICICPKCNSKHYFETDENGVPDLTLYLR